MWKLLRRLTSETPWAWMIAGAIFLSLIVSTLMSRSSLVHTVLQGRPQLTVIYWVIMFALLVVAVTLLIPSERRRRMIKVLIIGGAGILLVFGCYLALVTVHIVDGRPASKHGDLIDRRSSTDGQYEVRVFQWQTVLAEDGWDIIIRRRDGVEAFGGCLFSQGSGDYTGIKSIQAGSVVVATDEGSVRINFVPVTMQVPTPVLQCGEYYKD